MVNEVVLSVVYFVVRIAIFPYAYFLHYNTSLKKDASLGFFEVVASLHFYCNLGTLAIMVFQVLQNIFIWIDFSIFPMHF